MALDDPQHEPETPGEVLAAGILRAAGEEARELELEVEDLLVLVTLKEGQPEPRVISAAEGPQYEGDQDEYARALLVELLARARMLMHAMGGELDIIETFPQGHG